MTVVITQVKTKSTESRNQNLRMKGSMFLKENTKQCKKELDKRRSYRSSCLV